MQFSRFSIFAILFLSTMLLWTDDAGAQRIATVGVRPPDHPAPAAFAPAPRDDVFPAASADSLSLEPGEPSLLKHLVVGTVLGTGITFIVGATAVALTCRSSCEWAGLSVLLSTVLGAGTGFVIGGVVYVVKRVND